MTPIPLLSRIGSRAALAAAALTLASLGHAQTTAQTTALPLPAAVVAKPATTVAELSSVPVPDIAATAWIALDATSGQIIAADDPDLSVEPASLTKVMTAYLTFKAIEEGRLQLDQEVPVSEKAWRTGGSRMFIEPRKPVTVRELVQGVIVQSGNDASVALAEALAGSEEAFAALMNQEAQRLGMRNTNFLNATGLPHPEHVTTVRDLAILAQRITQDFPDHYNYYKQREFTYNDITQPNRNRLLWLDPTVDGMKTGHTSSAGYCLIATALRGDRRVVTVVVGAASETVRAQESLKLLNWSFQNFETTKLYNADQAAVQARVWKGTVEEAPLGLDEPLWVTVPRGKIPELVPLAERTDPLIAPLHQGQVVGSLKMVLGTTVLRESPLQVLTDVPEAGIVGRLFDAVRLYFQ